MAVAAVLLRGTVAGPAVVDSLLRHHRHKDGGLAARAVQAARGLATRIARGVVGALYAARRGRRLAGSRLGCGALFVPCRTAMPKEAGRAAVAAALFRRTVAGPVEEATSGMAGAVQDASCSGGNASTIANSRKSSCTTTWCGFPPVGVA